MSEEYTYYGRGYGKSYTHVLLDEYRKKVSKNLDITGPFEDDTDIIETLKLSLENGKSFYENAKPYMKKEMERYVEDLENGVKF